MNPTSVNELSAVVQALCSVISLVVVIVYTVITRGLLLESRLTRLAMSESHIAVYPGVNLYEQHVLIVRNDGGGPASDIKLVLPKPLPELHEALLIEQPPFNAPIPYLPAKEQREFALMVPHSTPLTSLRVEYKTAAGRVVSETYDVAMTCFGDNMAKYMADVANSRRGR